MAATTLPPPVEIGAVIVENDAGSVVSSPKYTAPLRDTPQTVMVIPQQIYAQQGATNLGDVMRNTPGITFAAGEGGGASATAGDAFYLRGFDASNNIFVDGVRDVGAYSRDVFNLEQVEVAKGSAGADVGRGASTGYVNLETKAPRAGGFTSVALTLGFDEATSSQRRRATLDSNQPLPASPIAGTAVRLNAMWQDSGAVGRSVAENRSWAVAPSLALGLGTPTRATLSWQHSEQDNLPDYGLPGAAYPGNLYSPAPPPIARETFYGFTADHDRVKNDALTGRIEHDVNRDFRVANQLRFSATERNAVVTTPGANPAAYAPATGLLTRSRQGNRRNTENLTNQTYVLARAMTGRVRHDISAGLEFSRETAYTPAFTNPALAPVPVSSPDPGASPGADPVRSNAWTDARIESGSLYFFDTLHLSERWQLNAGTRAERYLVDVLSVAASGVPTRIETDRGIVTWKSGLVFKPVPAGTLYAAYGISEKPPGSDFALSTAAGNQNHPDTEPQRTANGELGVKWDFFSRRLHATAAVFSTENDRTVFTDPVLGPLPSGRQVVRGLELGASGTLTSDWALFAGFAYLDTEVTNGTPAQVGAALPLVPRVSGNAWTTYRLPRRITLGGGTQYSGPAMRLQNTAAAPVDMPGYWLFSAFASWEVSPRLSLNLNVANVFNREYVHSYNNNGGRFMPGAPRAWLLTTAFSL